MRRTPLALLVFLIAAAPAGALADIPPSLEGDMTFDVKADNVAVKLKPHFASPPDTWSATVVIPAKRASADAIAVPEQPFAHGSGTGAPPAETLLAAMPAFRWVFFPISDVEVDVQWAWTSGGQTYTALWKADILSMYAAGQRSSGTQRGPFPIIQGSVFSYMNKGDEILIAPPSAYHQKFSEDVSEALGVSSFLSGRKLKPSVEVPWTAPPEGVKSVKVEVKYPNGRNPHSGIPVYSGAPGKAKLTAKGKRLVKQLGARKVAAKLASRGIADFKYQPALTTSKVEIYAPIGTCFFDHQRPSDHPCSQTCPPFPGVTKGYLMYTTLEHVYGSDTCTKGGALPVIPLY